MNDIIVNILKSIGPTKLTAHLGVSMFDPTREHDTGFCGLGWALMSLGHKQVDPKATR